jgi:hypothetical protein
MDALPSLVSNKRTLDEVLPDQEKAVKRSRLNNKVKDASAEDVGYNKILNKLPQVTNRVKRYYGIDKTRHSVLPHTFTRHFKFRVLYLLLLASEIRLLKVNAGEKDKPLQGTLIHTPLSAIIDRYKDRVRHASEAPEPGITIPPKRATNVVPKGAEEVPSTLRLLEQ